MGQEAWEGTGKEGMECRGPGVGGWCRVRWAPYPFSSCHAHDRIVMTDHGTFVLLNIYVPNGGDRPARARVGYKLDFLRALRRRADAWRAQGREVRIGGCARVWECGRSWWRSRSMHASRAAWMGMTTGPPALPNGHPPRPPDDARHRS